MIVRVYANVKGLAKAYRESEILSETTFVDFVRGFNMGNTMCDYIDAGNGKECSDEKVKGDLHSAWSAQPSDPNFWKQCSGIIWPMYTASKFFSVAPPTTDMPAFSLRILRTT